MYASTEPWASSFSEIIEFEDDAASIGSTLYKDLKVKVSGSTINVSGLKNGESVSLYSVGGVLLGTATASAGTTTLNAEGESIVIVKIGEQSIKVQL